MPVEFDEIPCSEGLSEEQRRLNRMARYREVRDELGLGVGAISRRLGINRDSWARYEREGGMPADAILNRIHKLSGKSHLWLRGG